MRARLARHGRMHSPADATRRNVTTATGERATNDTRLRPPSTSGCGGRRGRRARSPIAGRVLTLLISSSDTNTAANSVYPARPTLPAPRPTRGSRLIVL
ncbi:hypothetical protein EVAR_30827_1 [Eumeta japonica]|uniref:Uncharacterized protein n=1 Tax=Eumeta variegata TaxID=151549 RepID=A0A4C1XU98_EUMVA|nr:hypothetical protein EVAR_30827_1 [Eumeta japonica]